MTISKEKKEAYFIRMKLYLETYTKVFVVSVNNVRSQQMHEIRKSLRGVGEVLMGKNTLMRKVLRMFIAANPDHPLENLLPKIVGNIGLVFTNGDLKEVRDVILSNRVPAPARAGAVAPNNVVCPAGPTGCDPGQTSFFQALQIATKISRGQIEITSDVLIVKAGDKVSSSAAALLQKLEISPFTFGAEIESVYDDGSVFAPAVLDLTEADLISKFIAGANLVAAVSLAVGYPTLASLPHSIANAFQTLIAVAVECKDFSFPKAGKFKEFLADPSKFASASGGGGGGGEGAEEAKPEEEEEEEEADMEGAMDMFGGGDGADY